MALSQNELNNKNSLGHIVEAIDALTVAVKAQTDYMAEQLGTVHPSLDMVAAMTADVAAHRQKISDAISVLNEADKN